MRMWLPEEERVQGASLFLGEGLMFQCFGCLWSRCGIRMTLVRKWDSEADVFPCLGLGFG